MFHESNYNIIILDLHPKKDTKNIKYIKCDVSEITDIRNLIDQNIIPKNYNHIVTLAGGAIKNEWNSFEDVKIEDIKKSIDINLMGHVNVIHEFYPYMKNLNGQKSITMISSINSFASYGLAGYSAAKSGLNGFMYAIAQELSRYNIRINIVSPGTVVSNLSLNEDKKDWEILKKGTMLNHFTSPEDIAKTILMLSTNNSITGQNIIVDSGQLIKKK